MNEKILNEQIRMIYLTEDFKSTGLKLFSRLKNGTFSPEKAAQEDLPSLETLADFASKKLPTYNDAKKEVETHGKRLDDQEKTIFTLTIAALRDLQNEVGLRDHVISILADLKGLMGFGVKAGGETSLILAVLHILMEHFRKGSFLANFLKSWSIKFGAATVLIFMVYIAASIGLFIVKRRGPKS